jgi:hypothetical protein
MNIGLTVSRECVAPLFSGVDLWVVDFDAGIEDRLIVETKDWSMFAWKDELMRRDVEVLLCAGIDHFLLGALRGYGIEVMSNAVGAPDEVMRIWVQGWASKQEIDLQRLQRCRKGHRRRNRGGC